MNKVSITEKYCISKDKPEENCHGKCRLKKIIKKQSDKDSDP